MSLRKRIRAWRSKKRTNDLASIDEMHVDVVDVADEKRRKDMRMMSNCMREIQGPVADLCGLKSIMSDIPTGSPIYHYAKSMNTCGNLLAEMIQNMKLYYTLSADLYEVEVSLFVLRREMEFVLESLIEKRQILHLSEYTSDIGDIVVELHFGNDVPNGLVENDSTCVLKVFKSLVENAIRFTLKGKIVIQVDVDSITENRKRGLLHIVVSDTGVGVPEEAREAIFEPLTKAHAESIHGGVGMGLPVSKAMCEILDGSLELEERILDSGSTFHASFPISMRGLSPGGAATTSRTLKRHVDHGNYGNDGYAGEENDRSERRATIMSGDLEAEDDSQMPEILLVEDVELNRTIVSHMMRAVNVVPSIAKDGLESVEACRIKKFDVILMDITMPRMGGIEATAQIKENCPLNNTTPIIALTGTLAGKMESACLKAGMVQCIAKPVNRKELVESISDNVQRKHQVWMAS